MKIRVFLRYILQSIFLICSLGTFSSAYAEQNYDVVINPHIIEKNISLNSLRAIFGMRMQTWEDGTKIRVFVLSDDAHLHQKFSKGILRVFPYQLRSAWDRLVFSGIGQAPNKVNSTEEMLEKVANTPGAIGYLWRENINDSVEILHINK